MNYLIALSVNLAGTLAIYSLMALGLLRLRWRRRGIIPVLLTIIVVGFFWIAPTVLAFILDAKNADAVSYSLWLGNWLVSAFSVVILCQTVKGIPRQLEDSARLDGCGQFGIYRHVLLPLVWRELGVIAFLTLMATSALCWAATIVPGDPHAFAPPWILWIQRLSPLAEQGGPNPIQGLLSIAETIAGGVVVTLPVILIFFFSKRYLEELPRHDEATPGRPVSE